MSRSRPRRRSSLSLAAVVVSLLAVLGLVTGVGIAAAVAVTDPTGSSATTGPDHRSDRAKGLVYAGLARATHGPCAGSYEMDVPGLGVVCTHGPDPAPAGVDVTAYDTTTTLAGATTTAAGVPCYGDGVSGQRVQLLYVTASDVPEDYATILPTLQGWAAQMDQVVNASAAATGGERHIRFVTNPDCSVSIPKVVVSPAGDDSFSAMVSEVRAQGYASSARKYVMWANTNVYCGISQAFGDDSAALTNAANTSVGFSRIDRGCWGRTDHLSEVHELVHALGGVQPTAPHGTAGFHCTDESDALCYSDATGVVMTFVCPTTSEWLLDCSHDDYFSTAPAAGSYLATHWNVANSGFLATSAVATDPTPAPTPTATPTPTPTPTATPSPVTVTDTFTGSLTNKRLTQSFSLRTGAGAGTSGLTFTSKTRNLALTLRVVAADGTVVASARGTTGLTVPTAFAAATYRFDVEGTTSASFTLRVTHVAA